MRTLDRELAAKEEARSDARSGVSSTDSGKELMSYVGNG
jgi:hypothetical protein